MVNALAVANLTVTALASELVLTWIIIKQIIPAKLYGAPQFRMLLVSYALLFFLDVSILAFTGVSYVLAVDFYVVVQSFSLCFIFSVHLHVSYALLDRLKQVLAQAKDKKPGDQEQGSSQEQSGTNANAGFIFQF